MLAPATAIVYFFFMIISSSLLHNFQPHRNFRPSPEELHFQHCLPFMSVDMHNLPLIIFHRTIIITQKLCKSWDFFQQFFKFIRIFTDKEEIPRKQRFYYPYVSYIHLTCMFLFYITMHGPKRGEATISFHAILTKNQIILYYNFRLISTLFYVIPTQIPYPRHPRRNPGIHDAAVHEVLPL